MKNLVQKATVILSLVTALNFLSVMKVNAGGTYGEEPCIPVYGGGVECPRAGEVFIDKKVQNPKSGIFVDNILPSDPTRYSPKEIVTFHLIVQNAGEENLSRIVVKDTIPSFVDYMSIEPDNGASYDSSSRVLTFEVKDLAGGTSQTFALKARVVPLAGLPEEKRVICPINVVTAEPDGYPSDRDESQFCIEKEMVFQEGPVVPEAGPANWILSLGGLTTSMLAGLKLRRKK